ncbi:MAG: repair protein SbcC/Rad50 [Acidimicrobiaceae bacterium]|nr:repair protein SbcC/Rad50 [Acidimicrobiaceae bacterium]
MRPKRLEMEGFTAFREPTAVDFDGADLFALAGPTGAGKSSVVDAIGFALYGRIHRYNDKLVHAAISSGASEMRVRLDFTVGNDSYSAVRVVRRLGPGRATTKEARLERAGDVLAGDEKGLTAEITRMLGLDFDQYCRCVVLPQGAFASFLHDTPKGRQELLAGLLEVDHYRAIGQEAFQRASAAGGRAALLEERLGGDLAGATAEALAGATARVEELSALGQRVAEVEPVLLAHAEAARVARGEWQAAIDQRQSLSMVVQPKGVESLASGVAAAATALATVADAVAEAEEQVMKAAETRDVLGQRGPFERSLEDHQRRQRLRSQADAVRAEHQRLDALAARAAAGREEAAEAKAAADAALEDARQRNRAHALIASLVAGEPCPVCDQPVSVVPRREEPPDFAVRQAAVERANASVREATAMATDAAAETARTAGHLSSLEAQLWEVEQALAEVPQPAALVAAIQEIDTAEELLVAARRHERERRAAHRHAAEELERLREDEGAARATFESVRDAVAALGPPPPARTDLAEDWAGLVRWATDRAIAAADEEAAARATADSMHRAHTELVDQMTSWCEAAGVAPRDRPPGEAVAAAHAEAEANRRRVAEAIEEAARIRGELERLRGEEQVARSLALHLRSDHFEKWLLDEALADLTAGATGLLRELSGGAYSLGLDAKSRDFAVIDHRNADEVRAVRTLSGGETFLASLALALALADRITHVAASGAARLEALFLDEGFGTLDADTLDTVAAAMENLGSSGRMVGIVTHVRELAERVPVRYEVTKGPRTASVEKVLV